jgi:hypothetical protein
MPLFRSEWADERGANGRKAVRIMLPGGNQLTGGKASSDALPQKPSTEIAAKIDVSQMMVERPRAVSLRRRRMTL